MKKLGSHKLTKEEFDNIKLLIDAGIKGAVLEKITNRSSATCSYVRQSESYDAYNSIAKIKRSHPQPVEVNMAQQLQSIIDALALISIKVEQMKKSIK
jgi:hypothetical protein